MTLSLRTLRSSWSGASAPAPGVEQLEVEQLELALLEVAPPIEAVSPIAVERSLEAEPL